MALALSKSWSAGDILTAADLNQNFADVQSKFSAGITTVDLSSSAGITNAQLANSVYELVLSCKLNGTSDAGAVFDEGLNAPTTAFHVIGGVPYDATDGNVSYTILGVEHMSYLVTAAGSLTAAVFDLKVGNHTDGFNTVKTGLTTGTASTQTRESSFSTSTFTTGTNPDFFILDVTTAGVGFNPEDSWCISIKLKRTSGLRS